MRSKDQLIFVILDVILKITIMEIKKRVVKVVDKNTNNNGESNDKTFNNSNVVSVVFRSLILDLLAFTMILPLLPALLDHYKNVDDERGLYTFIQKQINGIQSYLNAPDRFSSVLFGGKIL